MHLRLALVLCTIASAACEREPAAVTVVDVPSVSARSSAEPAAQVPTAAAAPAETFKGFPGWVGFATVEGTSKADAPANAAAHVALSEQPQVWAALGSASRLRALAPGFSEAVGFVATTKIAFGCDGGEQEFAFFKGEQRPPRGAVWLVPPATPAAVVGVVEIPAAEVPAFLRAAGPNELRAWQVGDHWVFVVRRTEKAITAEAWEAQTRIWQDENEWRPMEGDDAGPPSLAQGGPGMPEPRMLLVAGDARLLVVQTDGYEGTNFTGLQLEKGSARWAEGRLYLYWCAF